MDDDLIAAIRGQAPSAAPTVAAQVLSPDDLHNLVLSKAEKYGIPRDYALRLVGKESSWDTKAQSKKGAKGLMQLMDATASARGVKDPYDPEQNVEGGMQELVALHGKYGDWPRTFAAYNAGPEAVDKAGGVPNFPETQDYVHTIMNGAADEPADPSVLAAIRGKTAPAATGAIPLAAASPGATTAAAPGQHVTPQQDVTFTKLGAAKLIDQNAPKGTVGNPYAQVKEGDLPDEPGAYYVDLKGVLQRNPGGDPEAYDVKKAYDAGHIEEAQQLAFKARQASADAFTNRFVSGAMLGGKNEAGAIIHHPIEFAAHGGFDNPVIQQRIAASDAQDAVQHARHPTASDAGAVLGGVTFGGALSALTGGTADLPLLGRLGIAGLEGGATGGANSYLAADGGNAQRAAAGKQGAEVGAVAGPAGELASAGGSYVANKLLGLGVSPETAGLALAARDKYGINLRGGQIADTPSTKFLDSVLQRTPFTGYAKSSAEQSTAFTKAVAKTFGEDAEGLTPEVMARARKRIGDEFDRVGAATNIKDTDKVLTDLGAVVGDAQKVLPDAEAKPLLDQVQEIASAIHTDPATGARTLSGESYQALTRRGSPLDRLTQSRDPNVAHYAQKMKDALLDAVGRNASADDVKALKLARTQYARLKTIEPLAEKAGPEGQISPALVMQAMRNNYDNLAYDGGGPLGELGQIGQRFLKEPPSSGTAERLRAQKLLELGGAAAGGGGALWLTQHPEEAAKLGLGAGAVTLGTLLAGKAGAVALDNPAYRAMLLRSAKGAPAIVGKKLLGRPKVVNAFSLPLAADQVLSPTGP